MKKVISAIMAIVVFMAAGFATTAALAAKSNAKMRAHSSAVVVKAVKINSADAQKLTTLKGIGPKKAQAIVAYRKKNGRFAKLTDLAKVKGIGEKWVTRFVKNNPGRVKLN